MKQQVNLFQPQFRRQKKPLRAATMLQYLALVGLGLAAAYAHERAGLEAAEARLAAVLAEEQAAQQRLAQAEAQNPPRVPSKRLEEELAGRRRQLEQHRWLAAALKGGAFGDPSGFSDLLEALARQHVAGTWLSRIEIGAGGRQLALGGHALEPEMVPLYVERLAQEAAFAGRSFSELTLERPEAEPLRVDFSISAGGGGGPAGSKGDGGNG